MLDFSNLNSFDFLGFLHTDFYVCQILMFTDIKYVILQRKWLGKYVCHTYGKYICLRIPTFEDAISFALMTDWTNVHLH